MNLFVGTKLASIVTVAGLERNSKLFILGSNPLDSDLGSIVASLHHGLAQGAHQGQSVDPWCQQGT